MVDQDTIYIYIYTSFMWMRHESAVYQPYQKMACSLLEKRHMPCFKDHPEGRITWDAFKQYYEDAWAPWGPKGPRRGRSWPVMVSLKMEVKMDSAMGQHLRNVQTHSEVSLAVEDDELFVELVRKSWKLWLSPKGMSQEISMQNWAAKNICWLDVLSWEMIEIEEDQWRRSLLGWRGLGLPGYPPFQFSSFASNIKLANIDIIYHISWSTI